MTLEEYRTYRLDVLSKTNAKNIHYINGQLGVILNMIDYMEHMKCCLESEKTEEDVKISELIKKSMQKINRVINQNDKKSDV